MKKIKVGNLAPVRLQIPVDDLNKPEVLQLFQDAQCSGLATIRYPANHGYCRVDLTVIGPQPEEHENDFPLRRGEAKGILQEITDPVETLEEESFGEEAVSL